VLAGPVGHQRAFHNISNITRFNTTSNTIIVTSQHQRHILGPRAQTINNIISISITTHMTPRRYCPPLHPTINNPLIHNSTPIKIIVPICIHHKQHNPSKQPKQPSLINNQIKPQIYHPTITTKSYSNNHYKNPQKQNIASFKIDHTLNTRPIHTILDHRFSRFAQLFIKRAPRLQYMQPVDP